MKHTSIALLSWFSFLALSCNTTCGIRADRLQQAVNRAHDGDTIVIREAVYDLTEADTHDLWLNPSNNRSGIKHVLCEISDKENLVIDGAGSTLVLHGEVFPFAVLNSRNITLRNFKVKTMYPACFPFTLTQKDSTGFTATINGETCPFQVKPSGDMDFMLDGNVVSSTMGRLSLHSMDRLRIQYLMTPDAPGDKSEFPASFAGVKASQLDSRTLRFDYYGDTHPKAAEIAFREGESIVINLAEKRTRCAFFVENSDVVRFENITISRFGGMGIVGQASGNIVVDHLDAMPDPGDNVSLTADIMQFINCYGQIAIRDSKAGYSLDDVLNIHGNYLQIDTLCGSTLRLRAKHESHAGFFPYRAADQLEIIDAHSRELYAKATVASVCPDVDDPYACTVTLSDLALEQDHEITAGLLVENVTLNPDILIDGCHFTDYPHVRLSGRGDILVRNNRMENCSAALIAMDLADYWYESGRIRNLKFVDNDLNDCNKMGGSCFINVGVSGWGHDAPAIHDTIDIRGNRVSGIKKGLCSVSGVKTLLVD